MRLSFVRRVLIIILGGLVLGSGGFALTDSPSATAPSPTTVPVATTAEPTTRLFPPRGTLVIHGTGDVNTDVSSIPTLASEGHDFAWGGLDGLFLDDDLTVINLECTPSQLGEALDKEFTFRCDPPSLPAMADAGVEVVNLANNHSGDHGKQALVDGRANVIEAGLLPVGVGADVAEATAPALLEVDGWTVAVVGFGGVVPSLDWLATPDRPGMADGNSIEAMTAAVEVAENLADLVLVSIHWGAELDTEPRPEDRRRAEALVDAGADVIFGHHSHRLQPLEMLGDSVVAWGLGNFVWPNFSKEGSTTAVARVVAHPDGTLDACLLPALITQPGHPELRGPADRAGVGARRAFPAEDSASGRLSADPLRGQSSC